MHSPALDAGLFLASFPAAKTPDVLGGTLMAIARRFLLTVMLLVVPVVATAAIYFATTFLLHMTNRTIDPHVLHYSAMAEYAVFLLLTVLDVKNRW